MGIYGYPGANLLRGTDIPLSGLHSRKPVPLSESDPDSRISPCRLLQPLSWKI
jgi:hypothetical protein